MKTLTIEVSDEFASNLEALAKIFRPPGGLGAVLDKLAGWQLENLVKEDGGALFEELATWTFDSEECAAVADAVRELLGPEAYHNAVWYQNEGSEDWEIKFLMDEQDEAIWNACLERRIDYDTARRAIWMEMKESPGMTALEVLDSLLAKAREEALHGKAVAA